MLKDLLRLFSVIALSTFVKTAIAENADELKFNDSHFHLTNYVQEGISPSDFLKIMGIRTPRSTLFGIPLQQHWSYRVTKDVAPTYYLDTDEALYYYSFTDAFIAQSYLKLSEADRKHFDPMITGFNPTDMYAADHIRRVLTTFPGVFTGIGEFTIHKEFVSSKIVGDVASLLDPALDRILDFAGEVGLVVLIHNDISMPFPKADKARVYIDQMVDLLRRHPNASIIWAHCGLGRIIQPLPGHVQILEQILADPKLSHVKFDISWDEVAKYIVNTPESTQIVAKMINKYPDRFLFGTDTVAPASADKYFGVFKLYDPLMAALTPEASQKLRLKNYERIFDEGRKKVRAWEAKNVH